MTALGRKPSIDGRSLTGQKRTFAMPIFAPIAIIHRGSTRLGPLSGVGLRHHPSEFAPAAFLLSKGSLRRIHASDKAFRPSGDSRVGMRFPQAKARKNSSNPILQLLPHHEALRRAVHGFRTPRGEAEIEEALNTDSCSPGTASRRISI
jgi:hypothetical protein